MIGAVYARKSTEQDRDTDARLPSIERQVEHARAYAIRKGWTVAEVHLYADDNRGGATLCPGCRKDGTA